MTRRLLLTGATGFVGQACLAPLLAAGYEVHAVARRAPGPTRPGLHWHLADLLDEAATERLVADVRPTHLLHLAWYVAHGKFWQAEENLMWLAASLALARAFVRHGGRRLVAVGTCAEYDWRHGCCVEGLTPTAPASLYGAAKLALHGTLEAYARTQGVSSAWARLFFLYGPGEAPGRLVPSVINALLDGTAARCSAGEQVRDYMHVADAAEALVALLDSDVSGAVNVASGVPVRVRDLVERLGAALGGRVQLGAPTDEAPLLVASTQRLKHEVGFRARFDLDEGLTDTIRWWQARRADAPGD